MSVACRVSASFAIDATTLKTLMTQVAVDACRVCRDRFWLPHIVRLEHRLVLRGNRYRECQHFVCASEGPCYEHAEPINRSSECASGPAFVAPNQIDLFWHFSQARGEVGDPTHQLGPDFLKDW